MRLSMTCFLRSIYGIRHSMNESLSSEFRAGGAQHSPPHPPILITRSARMRSKIQGSILRLENFSAVGDPHQLSFTVALRWSCRSTALHCPH